MIDIRSNEAREVGGIRVNLALMRAIVAVSCMWICLAQAHHSFSAFDNGKTLTIRGVVKSFEWTNPHSWMHVLVRDDTGKTVVWDIECGAPNINVRLGWSASDVKAGDKVAVAFHPRRDGTFGGTLASVTLADGRTLMGNGGRGGPLSGGAGPSQTTAASGTPSTASPASKPAVNPGAPSAGSESSPLQPPSPSDGARPIPAFLAPYQKPVPPGYPAPSSDPHDLEGAYVNPRLVAVDAEPPPYRPQTLERVNYFQKMALAGTPIGTLSDICRPMGMATELSLNFPFKIIQTAREVLVIQEEMHSTIRIHLDQTSSVKVPVSYEGYSVGHWQGDTLVVDTTGIDTHTILGVGHDPHSEALHQTLRIRKLNGGRNLELTFSFDDPQAYTRTWSKPPIVVDWRPDYGAFSEYDCEETAGSAQYAARYGVKVGK